MANGIDFSRLRRQNLFPETPDITQGGIMGIPFNLVNMTWVVLIYHL